MSPAYLRHHQLSRANDSEAHHICVVLLDDAIVRDGFGRLQMGFSRTSCREVTVRRILEPSNWFCPVNGESETELSKSKTLVARLVLFAFLICDHSLQFLLLLVAHILKLVHLSRGE